MPSTQAVMTSDELHSAQPSFSCTRNSLPLLNPEEIPYSHPQEPATGQYPKPH